ncbi:ESX secretion-associated protein EspG [Nocardia lijiangensis]|uniref:ESX secretion-associated protein EspG n=1 Tax=Nocardia lijiangensis TaxID=299618 RepID=UPI003D742E2D
MARTWEFTDLEFVVAWEPMRQGDVPRPFVFTSRTPRYEDYRAELAETRERLRTRLGNSFDGALETLARPDIRIVVTGWDGGDPADPKGRVCLLAARRGHEGCLVTQAPGETIWHSAGFTVAECDALRLADVVAAALPDRVAGESDRLVLGELFGEDSGFDHSYRRSLTNELTHDPERDSLQRFRRARQVGAGTIEIIQGSSRFGPRGITSRVLEWRDLDGDGRYLITGSAPQVATGADVRRLTASINAEIAEVVRAIKDERM